MKFLVQLLLCVAVIYIVLNYFGKNEDIPPSFGSTFPYQVSDVVQDPGGLRGRSIRITGIVRAPKKVLYWGGYLLEDLHNPNVQIWVQPAQSNIIPQESELVTIQGVVKQPIRWNDFELLLFKEIP